MSSTSSADRISAIRKSGLLDRPGSEQFHLLTEHVRVALNVPVAIISIVDEDRQVFAGHCGLPAPWDARGETPMTHSFCQYVVEKAEPLIVTDARVHELVNQNHAIGDLGVIGYLGVPIALPTGELVGALAAIDTVPRVWTERERQTLETLAKVVEREIALGVSELKYRTLFEDMQEGYYVLSAVRDDAGALVDVTFDEINPAFGRLTGLEPGAVVGKRLSTVVPTAMADMIPAYDKVFATGDFVVHANREPALGRWYENRIRRLDTERLASIFTDVTDRKDLEAQQELVNQEMAHRLKNTLAMVQAIATQTLKQVPDRNPVQAFEQRLQTLSSAHDILFRQNWQSAPVSEVVASVLDKVGQSERVTAIGPFVGMGPRGTLSTALILHELVTNAVKYGALSNHTGHVEIAWSVSGNGDAAQFTLSWHELGGPPVNPPASKGFGSRLIRMGLIGAGGVEIDYAATGLTATMTADLAQLQAE